VKTVVLGARPPELDALIERRKALDLDRRDEVWEGDYHMNPLPHPRHAALDHELARLMQPYADAAGLIGLTGFNLGESDDYRGPDHAWVRAVPDAMYVDTAPIVVEIVSPHDETYDKIPHYAAHGVDELVIADPQREVLEWRVLVDGAYELVERSPLLGVDVDELAGQLYP
jgi:Uma2 family endonuclease